MEVAIQRTHKNLVALVTALVITLSVAPAFARATVVNVTLWDKGAMSLGMLANGPMMGMAMGQQPAGGMGIKVSAKMLRAGTVTFAVTNLSKGLVHEMIVAPIKDVKTPLPYDKAGQKVDEEAAGHLGEVAELEPGKKGALTIDLKPGHYILYCNIAGHYALGMWTLITVK